MKCAVFQMQIEPYEKEKNYKKAEKFIQYAKENDADIILFPEMSFTGFFMDTRRTAEKDEHTVKQIRQMACHYKIAVGFGWVKDGEGKKAQNHYTIISKDGKVLSDYIKIHPFSFADEDMYFQGGDRLVSCVIEDISIGTQICYDLRFPESFQRLSEECDVIIVPANWPMKRREDWKCLLRARAIENQCYILGINCVGELGGQQYSGDSCAFLPDGTQVECVSCEEKMFFIEIKQDVEEYRSRFTTKRDRKKSLYVQWYKEKLEKCIKKDEKYKNNNRIVQNDIQR